MASVNSISPAIGGSTGGTNLTAQQTAAVQNSSTNANNTQSVNTTTGTTSSTGNTNGAYQVNLSLLGRSLFEGTLLGNGIFSTTGTLLPLGTLGESLSYVNLLAQSGLAETNPGLINILANPLTIEAANTTATNGVHFTTTGNNSTTGNTTATGTSVGTSEGTSTGALNNSNAVLPTFAANTQTTLNSPVGSLLGTLENITTTGGTNLLNDNASSSNTIIGSILSNAGASILTQNLQPANSSLFQAFSNSVQRLLNNSNTTFSLIA